jgi:signal peptidase II
MRHSWLVLVALLATIGCDRWTKDLATERLRGTGERSYLGGTVRLEYVENRGAFLGLGQQLAEGPRFWILTVGVGVLLGVMAARLLTASLTAPEAIAWALVVAGGASNLVDRALRHGLVVDFLNVGVGGLRTGVFNVADLAITTGAIALLVLTLRRRRTRA